jgi:hypothetical protein
MHTEPRGAVVRAILPGPRSARAATASGKTQNRSGNRT